MDKQLSFLIGILIVCLMFLLAAVILRPPMEQQQHPRLMGLQSELDGSGVDLDSNEATFATDQSMEDSPEADLRDTPPLGDTETVY